MIERTIVRSSERASEQDRCFVTRADRAIFGRPRHACVLGVGSATAQQSTWSPCAPARCIHTPHVWSPTREGNDGIRPTSRVSTCVCVPTACERPERVHRACTCGSLGLPSRSAFLPVCSVSVYLLLSFFLSVWTYRVVRALDTYAPISSPISPLQLLPWTCRPQDDTAERVSPCPGRPSHVMRPNLVSIRFYSR